MAIWIQHQCTKSLRKLVFPTSTEQFMHICGQVFWKIEVASFTKSWANLIWLKSMESLHDVGCDLIKPGSRGVADAYDSVCSSSVINAKYQKTNGTKLAIKWKCIPSLFTFSSGGVLFTNNTNLDFVCFQQIFSRYDVTIFTCVVARLLGSYKSKLGQTLLQIRLQHRVENNWIF